MVKAGERYKNYREVCNAMHEKVAAGNTKKAQLKEWGTKFRWHTEGNSYVIDEVYKRRHPKDDGRGGNHSPHVDQFMPYVVVLLLHSPMHNDWYGTQRLLKDLFELVPGEIYEQVNEEEVSQEKFCEMYGLGQYVNFLDFVHAYESVAKETIEGCFNKLQKDGCLKWTQGHMFKIGKLTSKFVCTDGFEKEITEVENAVCKVLSDGRGYTTTGKQILRYIRHSPREMCSYYDECLTRLKRNKKLLSALKIDFEEKHSGRTFNAQMLSGYYKGYHITDIKSFKLAGKAPPGFSSYQRCADELRTDIVINILERTKKRVQIPECDFKNLKTLFLTLHGINHL